MDIAKQKAEIPDGYITTLDLFGKFFEQMKERKSWRAVKEYKSIKGIRRIGVYKIQEWDDDLFNELVEKYRHEKRARRKVIRKEIPRGYITSKNLLEKFIEKTGYKNSRLALKEYKSVKPAEKYSWHMIQKWDRDLFNKLANKYKVEKIEGKKATYKNPEIPEGHITSSSLFDELVDKHITIRAAKRKGYTQREIPQGYIIATQLFEKFSKILKPSKGKKALADYQAVKTPQKYGRHQIQEWDEDLFEELVEKYEEKRKVAVKKIKKAVIHAGLSPKEILEKAKELNRKVKVVPMGYSPSWEREKKVIKEQKEQFDKSEYKPKDYSIHTPKGSKIHVPEGYLKVKDLREKFLEETGSYVTRLDKEYRSQVKELILGSVKAYEWNEEIFKEVTSNYKKRKKYKK